MENIILSIYHLSEYTNITDKQKIIDLLREEFLQHIASEDISNENYDGYK